MSGISPNVATRRVLAGRYVLVVGDRAGTEIELTDHDRSRALAQAIARARKEHQPPPPPGGWLERGEVSASEVTDKVEHAVSLFIDIAQGRRDLASIGDQTNVLLDLLRRLDHEQRWEEALRVAGALAKLLALCERWVELLHSLQTALSAAERLGNLAVRDKAWALHELGTLHLAADKHADADRLLSQARDLRKEAGDWHDLKMTEHNLQVLCRILRVQLHQPPNALMRILRKPVAALALGILLLIVGGVAGAVIRGPGKTPPVVVHHTVVVHHKLKATSPPAITSVANTTFNTQAEGSFAVTVTGKPSPTLTETGTLPDGVTFNAGVLTGTPTATGVYPIDFHAANGVSPDSTQRFTLTVDSPPAITSAANTTFDERAEGSFTVTATGTPSPTLTETGTLPNGVTFNAGVLTGTPTATGVYPIEFHAANGVGPDSTQSFTLTVEAPR